MENKADIERTLAEISNAKIQDNFDIIDSRLSAKRLEWFEENKHKLNLSGSDVRKAYTLLIVEYLGNVFGLDASEAAVVYEDENKIVWRSYNWCPVLEACKIGQYDTREICKKGWEKSVQALIEKINPKLVFSRDYEKLRPYGDYCEESIELRAK